MRRKILWTIIFLLLAACRSDYSQSLIIIDPATYTKPIQYASAPCWGTCDLSPSYNGEAAPSAFNISKITFDWSNFGGNNCDQVGHYSAFISGNGSSSGTFASSSNSVYVGCGGSNGSAELDFANQTIPKNFSLNFASVDGGLQGGAGVNVTNVEIWGSLLTGNTATQIGLPVLFVHGWCDTPDSFVNAETAVKNYLNTQLPSLYPLHSSPPPDEYVAFFDGVNVQFQTQGPENVSNSTKTQVDSSTRFFLADFNDSISSHSLYQEIDKNTSAVADIHIYEKGYELAKIIASIKAMTHAPRVIVVAHSMGGLVARSYIEGLASPTGYIGAAIPYLHDIAALVTLDTPHGGAASAELNGYQTWFDVCSDNPSIDKSEMIPSGIDSSSGTNVQSIIPELNFNGGNAKPLPPDLTITSIASTWSIVTPLPLPLPGLGTDNVLGSTEQDLGANLLDPVRNSESTLYGVSNSFGPNGFLIGPYLNFCGFTTPLHQLSCTGSSSQTFQILGPAVLSSSVIFPDQVQITPSSASVAAGFTKQFTSSAGPGTTWSILEGSSAGTISPTGLYTAPTDLSLVGSAFHIVAVNNVYPNQYGEATVTVIPSQATQAPTIIPASGTYASTQTITISDISPGAVIYYTSNGTTPTTSSPKYTGAISVSSTESIQAIAIAPGYTPSTATSATFTITQSEPGVARLTNDGASNDYPAWSPKWNVIMFTSTPSSNSSLNDDIWEMWGDGNLLQQVTSVVHDVYSGGLTLPSWIGTTGDIATLNTDFYYQWLRFANSTNPTLPVVRSVLDGSSPGFGVILNIPGGLGSSSLVFSPDGTNAVWAGRTTQNGACPSQTEIWVAPVSTLSDQASSTSSGSTIASASLNCGLTIPNEEINGASVSPDGSQVVFAQVPDPNSTGYDLFIYKLDGTYVTRLTQNGTGTNGVVNWRPSWSSDNRIAFASNTTGRFEIWTTNPDGSALRQITTEGGSSPSWSPDATKVAFTSTRDGSSQIYSIAVPTGTQGTQFSAFSSLTPSQTILFGTSSVNVSGVLNAGASVPIGDTVSIAAGGISATATVSGDGTFSATLDTQSLTVSGSPYTITYSFTGAGIFSPASDQSTTLTVNSATPTITWAAPSAITYGAVLSATQLNATSTIAGTLAYTPSAGTILNAGSQTLSVTLTPTDTTDYAPVTQTVPITVNKASLTVTASSPTVSYGSPVPIITPTYSGYQNGDAVSVVTTAPTCTTTYTVTSAVNISPPTSSCSGGTVSPNYSLSYLSGTVTIVQATSPITWTAPGAITYGTALSTAQLDASSTVAGTFSYTPASGSIMTAGSHTLSATFSPTDATDYATATATVALVINQAKPTINWAAPAPITYGTALSANQLNASPAVAGSFTYAPALGTVLGAGTQILSLSFLPTDAVDFTTATQTVKLTVNQVTPAINWPAPAPIIVGTALSTTQLDATSPVAGMFVYSPVIGTVLAAGTQTLSVTFTPTDNTDYTLVTKTIQLTVNPSNLITPKITWTTPAAITYGTSLSGKQLDASSNVAGSFVYSPPAGTVLTAGTQTLSATFTPTNQAKYATATATVKLTVNQGKPVITWATPAAITYGTPLSSADLDAESTVAGDYVYSPATGAIPGAGSQTLSVTFTPNDSTDYTIVTAAVKLIVSKATPAINWTTPAPISYGTPLSSTQLDASSSVAGSFAYSSTVGTVLGVGAHTITVTFTPTDTTDYTTAKATVSLTVGAASQAIAFTQPSSPVVYGVSPIALSATSSSGLKVSFSVVSGPAKVSGSTLTITGAGTIVVAANQPGNSKYTAAAQVTETVVVNQATPTVALKSSASSIAAGKSVTFTSTLVGGSVKPTGTVTFLDSSTELGTATLNSSGVATYATNTLSAAKHSITASYGGDVNYVAATSAAVSVTITAK
jgi:pimeloyl-ACP methyl ester carboxylesterase